VVAQLEKGQNNLSSLKDYFATDYMLGTILFVYCLLFINTFYLSKLDVSRNNNILLNSQNKDTTISSRKKLMNIQSAENCKGFSETVRQLPEIEDSKFWNWFAGIIDGDGNFDIRVNPTSNKRVLKQIRIKLHNRDLRILRRIQDYLHSGAVWCRRLHLCLKLSNSRDILKLLIPNLSLRLGGWSNYSGKVTSQKMSENEMDYRGSKSDKRKSVKEQRVDGSWLLNKQAATCRSLRRTLMGCESSYQIKILSNQINKQLIRYYSNKVDGDHELNSENIKLNPWYLTGFTDAEGCFFIKNLSHLN